MGVEALGLKGQLGQVISEKNAVKSTQPEERLRIQVNTLKDPVSVSSTALYLKSAYLGGLADHARLERCLTYNLKTRDACLKLWYTCQSRIHHPSGRPHLRTRLKCNSEENLTSGKMCANSGCVSDM